MKDRINYNEAPEAAAIAVGTEFTIGGIGWTVIHTDGGRATCLASRIVEERAFDADNGNDFGASDLREWLNGEFLQKLIGAGAPEDLFEAFEIDLTADDGLKKYGKDTVRIGLITCDQYRAFRDAIPPLPNEWWWTATADSPVNHFVRYVYSGGTLYVSNAFIGYYGVRPLCVLKSEILVSYINGEGKKRAEAVDMMKHIAAAWNVKPEEIFGGLDDGDDD